MNNIKKMSLRKRYYKDNILFYSGEQPSHLIYLETGTVKLYSYNNKGNEIVVKIINLCNFILPTYNLIDKAYMLNCSFIEDSDIYLIDRDLFLKEAIYNRESLRFFLKSIEIDNIIHESFIKDNFLLTSKQKICKFLLEYQDILNKFNQKELAVFLNITPEFLSINIQKLIKSKIIKRVNGKIVIISKSKLIEVV